MTFRPWVTPPTQLAPAAGSSLEPAGHPPLRARLLGDTNDPLAVQQTGLNTTQKVVLALHSVILIGSAYHGYRRNENSILWGASWALGAALCPSVTLAFALSQGFAKSSGGSA